MEKWAIKFFKKEYDNRIPIEDNQAEAVPF